MTELLTREEYAAIAADLDLPAAPFIDGKFRKGNGPVMETVNPATGEVLKKISTANAEDVDFAVKKAREAFDRGEWSRAHPSERKDVLIRFCKLITRRRHELAAGLPEADGERLTAAHNLAEALREAGRHEEALRLGRDTLATRHRAYGPEHQLTLQAMRALAAAHADSGARAMTMWRWR